MHTWKIMKVELENPLLFFGSAVSTIGSIIFEISFNNRGLIIRGLICPISAGTDGFPIIFCVIHLGKKAQLLN